MHLVFICYYGIPLNKHNVAVPSYFAVSYDNTAQCIYMVLYVLLRIPHFLVSFRLVTNKFLMHREIASIMNMSHMRVRL